MNYRPYQLDAIENVRQAMCAGKRRVLLVMPTGAGKTCTGAEIVRRTIAQGRRALWLAHRAELIDQAADALTRAGLNVGAICASASTPPNPFAPVQVASVQTLLARGQRPPADMIVADEAHHFADAAPEFLKVLQGYPNALLVGPTATPERGDGTGLGGFFDDIVVGISVRELVDMGYLVPCRVERPSRALGPGDLAQSPVDAYRQHAAGRRAIVFVRSVELAESYAREFVMHGIAARALSGETPWAERRETIAAFRRGELLVLVNVYVLTEGFDAPEASCCILARGAGSGGMMLQMVGRVLRPWCTCGRVTRGEACSCAKPDALVLDLRGVSYEHGHPEDDRDYSLSGRGIVLRDPNSYCPVCHQLKEPGAPCTVCEYVPSGESRAAAGDTVLGLELKPYQRIAASDDDAERARRLARWIAYARKHGYRDGWWKQKFLAVYGQWPRAQLIASATAIANTPNRVASAAMKGVSA